MMKTVFILLALFAFAGNALAETPPGAPARQPSASGKFPNQGKVLDTMDASIYTYIQVTTDNGPVWLAASRTKVAKGDTIRYPNGASMANFYSPSLKRTFDTLIMIDKIEVVKK